MVTILNLQSASNRNFVKHHNIIKEFSKIGSNFTKKGDWNENKYYDVNADDDRHQTKSMSYDISPLKRVKLKLLTTSRQTSG